MSDLKNTNYNINEGEILSEISSKYELDREGKRINIEIRKIIQGNYTRNYIAIPTILTNNSDIKYCGSGTLEVEALQDCLNKIKNIPFETIFPFPSRKPTDE